MVFPKLTRIVLVGTALIAAGLAWSQAPGGQAGRPSGSQSGGTSHIPVKPQGPDVAPPASVQGTVQYRLDLLEEDLRLRPEQSVAWATYRSRVLKLAEDMQRASRSALGGDLTAPKRLDRLADIARDRLTAIEDIVDAGKALYAAFTPEQKIVADRRMAVPVMVLAGVEPNASSERSLGPPKYP